MTATNIIDTQAHIETPENVRLSFRLAGPGTRLGAYLVDLMIRIVIGWALLSAVSAFAPFLFGAGLSLGLGLLFLFLLEWFYSCLFEGFWTGRTPGKWVLGLRVIKDGGYPIGFYEAVIRNLLRAADGLPLLYGVGFVVMVGNRRMQRLGDLLAGTIVVRERRQRLRGQLPFLHSVPVIPRSQRAGFRPSDRTLDLVERLFLRAGQLAPARADEIARILAHPLADRLGISDTPQVLREPSRFLLRVLRTFSQPDDGPEGAGTEATARDLARPVAILSEGAR